MRDRPSWCVSVGATIEGKPMLGVIFDPVKDESYSAAVGRGATRNGDPIAVNKDATFKDATLNKSAFCVGFTSARAEQRLPSRSAIFWIMAVRTVALALQP